VRQRGELLAYVARWLGRSRNPQQLGRRLGVVLVVVAVPPYLLVKLVERPLSLG
jgi:hypothetical protein